MHSLEKPSSDGPKLRGVSRVTPVTLPLAAALVGVLAGCGSSTAPTAPTTTAPTTTAPTATPYGPTTLDEAELKAAVGALGQSVYWVGPKAGDNYGLRRLANGQVFLRYLPAGVKANSNHALLTIGTYPFKNAYQAEIRLSTKPGWKLFTGSAWFAVYRPARPTNIYLTKRSVPYQVEIYDPSAAKARALARSSRIVAIR